LTALVGGQKTSLLFGILDKAFGIRGSGLGSTILSMIQAQLVPAQGIEQSKSLKRQRRDRSDH
jgi:hypothetical protein